MTGDRSSAHPSRRDFIEAASRGALVLVVGLRYGRLERLVAAGGATTDAAATLAPNQWLSLDEAGVVTLTAYKTEMGQGVRTSLPAILAAELGADWKTVRIRHAEPGPDFPDMGTSGSGSIEDSWIMLRRAAAAMRALLTQAAADEWRVPASECDAREGAVIHTPTARKLAFGSLVPRAATLPVPQRPPLRPDAELDLLGTRLKRVDAPDIVVGRPIYGIDARTAGMRFAVLARPPVSGATLAGYDEAAALRVAGVERVARLGEGVAVVASNSWAAMRGRDALAVRWRNDQRPDVTSASIEAALMAALPNGKVARREGDVPAAFGRAARTLEATYVMPHQAHAAIEPLSCVADVRADRCEIWVGTQRANRVRSAAAEITGLREEQVAVHMTLMGGAFGRRIAIDHAREAIALSHAIRQPVQLLWTREDEFAHDMFQPPQVNRLRASLDANGEVVAWQQQVADCNLTMFGALNPNANPAEDEDPWGGYDNPYVFPAFDVTLAVIESPVPTGAWRSVTYPGGVFARESFLDEIAHAAGRDPLALRLELLARPHNQPAIRNAARTAERLRNVLRLAADGAGWPGAKPRVENERRRALGIACNAYHTDGAVVAQVADVSVGFTGDVRVHKVTTAIDVGRVIDRSGLEAQVQGGVGWALSAALATQVPIANGRPTVTQFGEFPVLRMRDMPAQEVIIVDSPLPPFGAGEPPVPAVYAAVANAICAATGRRLRRTPLRLA